MSALTTEPCRSGPDPSKRKVSDQSSEVGRCYPELLCRCLLKVSDKSELSFLPKVNFPLFRKSGCPYFQSSSQTCHELSLAGSLLSWIATLWRIVICTSYKSEAQRLRTTSTLAKTIFFSSAQFFVLKSGGVGFTFQLQCQESATAEKSLWTSQFLLK